MTPWLLQFSFLFRVCVAEWKRWMSTIVGAIAPSHASFPKPSCALMQTREHSYPLVSRAMWNSGVADHPIGSQHHAVEQHQFSCVYSSSIHLWIICIWVVALRLAMDCLVSVVAWFCMTCITSASGTLDRIRMEKRNKNPSYSTAINHLSRVMEKLPLSIGYSIIVR